MLPVEPPWPMAEGDAMFEELVEVVEALPKKERPGNDWIHPGTWASTNERTSYRKQGTLTQAEGWKLKRRIHNTLAADR